MNISALVKNAGATHNVTLATGNSRKTLPVPPKASGSGSDVNGGEFLMLALATCYCNDLYREAARLGVVLEAVAVEASADFEGIGLAARNISYRAQVTSAAPPAVIARLLRETDAVAEIHNTLRAASSVTLARWNDRTPATEA